ncbi:proprotein convertase P-domain-containing protein [Candidatus Methylomirabilis sp.]|uniref:proprotein convertase P-domain-containing protein n=1 Tax=Candidatus Methylomirabilis sp. TaxID=2032687 RepID=UPI002A5C39A1|nr:proprotein convertase P-domain-containing protein [Candidatus Methylomirabilis sp.]
MIEAFDVPLVNGTAVLGDTAGGNGNGVIDPGETIVLTVPVSNNFTCIGLTSVAGALSTTTTGVTITQASSSYGNLSAGAAANGTAYQFTVAQSVPCGTLITFTLNISSAEGASSARTITLRVGQAVTATTYTYTGSPVSIPDNNPTGAIATLTVPGSLVIGDINLNLTNITHTWIGDLVVQLIAPDGTNITMINRPPNGTGSNGNDNFTNTVLDDEATNSIQSQTGSVTNASFRPANPLSGFANKAGNGTWTLKIIDAASVDTGTITAWSLTIAPITCTVSQTVTLTVTVRGSANGTVTGSGMSCSTGSTCIANYTSGTPVTLTEAPGSGASFKSWGGACSGTATTCTVTMTASQSVTATFSQVFTDPTLTARSTPIKAVHVTELRSAINTLRAVNSLSAFSWTDPTLTVGTTPAKKVHMDELRQALNETGGPSPSSYETLVAQQTPIKASHISDLRNAVRALE